MIDIAAAYELHRSGIWCLIRRRLHGVDDAVIDDLTADTFMRAVRAADRFQGDNGAAWSWLAQIARNLVIDYLRDWQRKPTAPLTEWSAITSDAGNERHADTLDIHDAMARLAADRPHDEALLRRRYRDGYAFDEVADCGYQAAKSRVHRALGLLRRELTGRAL